MQGGERRTWKEEWTFWQLGTVLLIRDCRRDLPLLLDARTHGSNAMDVHSSARAERMSTDLKSLIPFLFIAMNTVPFTPVIMPVLLRWVGTRVLSVRPLLSVPAQRTRTLMMHALFVWRALHTGMFHSSSFCHRRTATSACSRYTACARAGQATEPPRVFPQINFIRVFKILYVTLPGGAQRRASIPFCLIAAARAPS